MVGAGSKYVYHLNSNSWEYLRNIHLNNCHENIIGAGNFMYWTDMGYLCVVDMESGRTFVPYPLISDSDIFVDNLGLVEIISAS
ncbi:hypothetical protein CsSME_00004180 [Camellia sinensis var. sinensis]